MMREVCLRTAAAAVLLAAVCAPAYAQQSVTLTDTSQTTTLTAIVSEQARVTVPAGVTFAVNDVMSNTPATAASVTIQSIVLATATKQLQVSLQASAASFTPPSAGVTWDAADVTWNAATWTNATGASGTLSNSAFGTVATCTAGVSTCSTVDLVFTLGAKPTVNEAGSHTLDVVWKFESIGT